MASRPPSLRSLAAFEAAARRSSFAGAATELNLTPGAVSHAIAALETRLNQKLFARSGRGVALTDAGRLFAARVRLGLNLITDAFDDPRAARPTFTLSVLPSIAARVLAPRLGLLRETLPDRVLEIRVSGRLETFSDDTVDLAIRFGPGEWAGLKSRRLGAEVLFPVCTPAYRDALGLETPADLARCDVIEHPESGWRLWLDGLQGAPDLRPALRIDDASVALDAAVAGQGVALARGALARDDLEAGRLVRLFDHEAPAEYAYACVWRPGRERDADRIAAVAGWFEAVLAGRVGLP